MKKVSSLILSVFLIVLTGCLELTGSNSDDSKPRSVFTSVVFPTTPEQADELTKNALGKGDESVKEILSADENTFENTIKKIDTILYNGKKVYSALNVLSNIAPDKEIRDSANENKKKIAEWYFKTFRDENLFRIISGFEGYDNNFKPEGKALLTEIIDFFKVNGMGLDPLEQDKLNENDYISEVLIQQINYNLVNDIQGENPGLLDQLMELRAQWAEILKYNSYSEFVINRNSLAASPDKAADFIEQVFIQAEDKLNLIKEKIRELKKDSGEDSDPEVYRGDIFIYFDYLDDKYGLDQGLSVKMYPMENVIDTLFHIAEKYFEVKIVESSPDQKLWSEDVRFFKASDLNTGKPLGSFYMDLFSRQGKNGIPRVQEIANGKLVSQDLKEEPLFVFITDIDKSESEILLSHNQVVTLFHEFGHVINILCKTNNYRRTDSMGYFSFDFVEIHSQFFELFSAEKEVLEMLLKNNPEKLEKALSLLNSYKERAVLNSFYYTAISKTDLICHSGSKNKEAAEVFHQMMGDYYLPYKDKSEQKINRIAHYIVHSPAEYYGYIWSKAIVYDIASKFELDGKGLLNKDLTLELKEKIFEVSLGNDLEKRIESFLKRDISTDAYMNNFIYDDSVMF